MAYEATFGNDVRQVATPPAVGVTAVQSAMGFPSLVNPTVPPLGAGATVAVKVTPSPVKDGFRLEVRVVVVGVGTALVSSQVSCSVTDPWPPKRSKAPPTESKPSEAELRADGLGVRDSCTQPVPFHSQVSPSGPVMSLPPKRTSVLSAVSSAKDAP
jgi:hypothetical protein